MGCRSWSCGWPHRHLPPTTRLMTLVVTHTGASHASWHMLTQASVKCLRPSWPPCPCPSAASTGQHSYWRGCTARSLETPLSSPSPLQPPTPPQSHRVCQWLPAADPGPASQRRGLPMRGPRPEGSPCHPGGHAAPGRWVSGSRVGGWNMGRENAGEEAGRVCRIEPCAA